MRLVTPAGWLPLTVFIVLSLPGYLWGNALCVSVERANLRANPSTNAKITWTVGRYMPLLQTGSKGGWVKVQDLDGETHWILGSNVSGRIQCVVVKSKFTNLRTKPTTGAPLADITLADRYTPFKKLQREEAWLQVEDEMKEKYWIIDSGVWWPVKRSSLNF